MFCARLLPSRRGRPWKLIGLFGVAWPNSVLPTLSKVMRTALADVSESLRDMVPYQMEYLVLCVKVTDVEVIVEVEPLGVTVGGSFAVTATDALPPGGTLTEPS